MIISGIVVDVEPGRGDDLLTTLQATPGITKAEGPVTTGRLVAVIEADDNAALESLMNALIATPGILGVNPAFIHFDA